jgi:Txe/YoeB family toxin of Txe-Axe toxin-antitoxin module
MIRAFARLIASTWTWANMFRPSLRIDSEHRFIYRITGHAIEIANLRHHH